MEVTSNCLVNEFRGAFFKMITFVRVKRERHDKKDI